MRRKGIGSDRTEKTTPVEKEEAGQEAPLTFKVVLRHALIKIRISFFFQFRFEIEIILLRGEYFLLRCRQSVCTILVDPKIISDIPIHQCYCIV